MTEKRSDIYREMLNDEEENRIKFANLKKIIELQRKYVELVVKAYNEAYKIAQVHGYRPNTKKVEKGERLIEEMKKPQNG